jgi:beta-phosphoglucomutase-like phosphatase (HAD superfamily)
LTKSRIIEVPEYIKGLIFDCDGTLVDSMPLHMEAWKYAVTEGGGVWNYEFFFSKKGMKEEDIVEAYNRQSRTPLNCIITVNAKHNYVKNHRSAFKPIKPVVDIVLRYKDVLPMAVASGGIREIINLELDALGIREYFKAILTADDDINPKPRPDIFLEAAARIGVLSQFCQVFEDGDIGLEAAKSAGMLATDIRSFL